MSKSRILFVLTGHDRLGPAGDADADRTGFHLSEAAKPWRILTQAGILADFVTPRGGPAPIDPSSKDLDDADNVAFLEDASVRAALENAKSLADVQLEDYDGIYFPGGHGTMWDFPDDDHVQQAVRSMYEDGKVVGAVCHGPAALVNVTLSDGSYLVDGKTVSAFTDDEERAVEKETIMPFMLSSCLAERGAKLDSAANFEASVSVDGRLVTGQNPASAADVGESIRDLVNQRDTAAA